MTVLDSAVELQGYGGFRIRRQKVQIMSNGEFWKKKKNQRPADDNSRGGSNKKGSTNTGKRSFGQTSSEPEWMKESDALWMNKLTPSVISDGSPVDYTVSIAIPSSILKTAKSTELKTYLVGQIARACAIHEVDEIIVYMDTPYESSDDLEKGPGVFFCRLLQYLECPPYLRDAIFPVHNDLKFAGLLPPLNMPHHMSSDAVSLYREGVVVDKPIAKGSMVNIGLQHEAIISHQLQAGIRVTVKLLDAPLSSSSSSSSGSKVHVPLKGEAVSPLIRQQHGLYWGYQTRLVSSFSEVFVGCPYIDSDGDTSEEGNSTGYDLLIGNSERGSKALDSTVMTIKPFKHALIVFGGVGGIEACVEAEKSITISAKNTECLFDHWLDLAPSRGSRAVRTEEAVLIGLAKLTAIFSRTEKAAK